MSENIINNNALAALAQRAAPHVLSAIKHASAKTGVNFAYLVEQAAAESSFDEKAQARTSSAAGLYQFIESTWLNMVKKHGHKYGLGKFSSVINDKGKVSDPQIRREILDLRKDPKAASFLAAEFAAENKAYLQRHIGGDVGPTELYFAHFMGAGGAAGFLKAMRENPLQNAADLFPKAARANYNVFYDRKTGKARTLAGVYEFFDKKFSASEGADMVASAPKSKAKTTNYSFEPSLPSLKNPLAFNTDMPVFTPLSILTQDSKDNSSGWRTMPFGSASLVMNPVELMLMANLEQPVDYKSRQ